MAKATGRKKVTKSGKNAYVAQVMAQKAAKSCPVTDEYRQRLERDIAACKNAQYNTKRQTTAGELISIATGKEHPGERYLNYISDISEPDLRSTILVEIPSYCDPELKNTIEAALRMAVNPERIHFSVCLQDDDPDIFEYLQNLSNCSVEHFAQDDSPGICAARWHCQQLYDGEDFVFHIDSHMRFARYWDIAIIDQWYKCNDKKAILSSWGVDLRKEDLALPVDSDMFNYLVPVHAGLLSGRQFVEGPGVIMPSFYVSGRWDPRFVYGNCFYDFKPRPGAFICGHYVFGSGEIDTDVPIDRYMAGDELAVVVRYYTHGYNIYHPGAAFVYHLWQKESVYDERIMKADGEQTRRNRQIGRLEQLLKLAEHSDVDLSGFELGTERTLQDYEAYCGLTFKRAEIARFASEGRFGAAYTAYDKQPINWQVKARRICGDISDKWTQELLNADPDYQAIKPFVGTWKATENGGKSDAKAIVGFKVTSDTSLGITLSWDGMSDKYIIQGVTSDISFETISIVNTSSVMIPRETADSYQGFRVVSCDSFGAAVSMSNVLVYNRPSESVETMSIRFMSSYGNKICVSFMCEGIYAQYHLYDCTDNGYDLVASSEDFMLLTDRLIPGHSYVAVGYAFENRIYVPKISSERIVYTKDTMYKRENSGGRTPVLSIIMPVCNTEKYLPRAVDSILVNTLSDIEIVLIDDGSVDGSVDICEWYVSKYDFIKLLYTDRIGPSSVRNRGIDAACGKWIAYMDSDDMIHPYTYEKLYDAARKTGSDIAVMQTLIRTDFGSYDFVINPFAENPTVDMFVTDMHGMFISPLYCRCFWCSVCNKIVSADVAKKVYGPEKSYFPYGTTAYEDVGYTPALYSYASKFVVVRGAYYIWEKRHKSFLGARTYYWGENGDRKISYSSQLTHLWGVLYASENCNPDNRYEVDAHVIRILESQWKSYVQKFAKRNDFAGFSRTFAEKIVFAAERYSFRENPYIKGNVAWMSFLDDMEKCL